MKLICSSPELSLAAVRQLSENAVNHPWSRQLRCRPWLPSALIRVVPVHQPWRQQRDVADEEEALWRQAQHEFYQRRPWMVPTTL